MPEFTPTESRLLRVLADGKPHAIDELTACLWDDEFPSRGAVIKHICSIRKKLHPHGQSIRCLDSTPFHPLSYAHVTRPA